MGRTGGYSPLACNMRRASPGRTSAGDARCAGRIVSSSPARRPDRELSLVNSGACEGHRRVAVGSWLREWGGGIWRRTVVVAARAVVSMAPCEEGGGELRSGRRGPDVRPERMVDDSSALSSGAWLGVAPPEVGRPALLGDLREQRHRPGASPGLAYFAGANPDGPTCTGSNGPCQRSPTGGE